MAKAGSYTTITVDNLDRLMDRLSMFPVSVQKKLIRGAARKAAKPMLAKAKALAPVGTVTRGGKHPRTPGTLRDSIAIRGLKRTKKNKGRVGVAVAVGEGWYKGPEFYAAFIEFGTNRMEAQPFMRPAAKEAADEVRAIWRDEIHAATTYAVNDVQKIKGMGRSSARVGDAKKAIAEALK